MDWTGSTESVYTGVINAGEALWLPPVYLLCDSTGAGLTIGLKVAGMWMGEFQSLSEISKDPFVGASNKPEDKFSLVVKALQASCIVLCICLASLNHISCMVVCMKLLVTKAFDSIAKLDAFQVPPWQNSPAPPRGRAAAEGLSGEIVVVDDAAAEGLPGGDVAGEREAPTTPKGPLGKGKGHNGAASASPQVTSTAASPLAASAENSPGGEPQKAKAAAADEAGKRAASEDLGGDNKRSKRGKEDSAESAATDFSKIRLAIKACLPGEGKNADKRSLSRMNKRHWTPAAGEIWLLNGSVGKYNLTSIDLEKDKPSEHQPCYILEKHGDGSFKVATPKEGTTNWCEVQDGISHKRLFAPMQAAD